MAITAEARTDIIALVVGMFDAAPGATYLSQFVNAADAGSTVETLAADLTGTGAFKGIYPDLQTANEFATKFVNNIAPEATDAAKAWAVTWIEAQLNGGATKAEVIVASINALRATDESDANWGNAAAALNNKVEVAEWYSVDQLGNAVDLATLQNTISTVTSDDTTVTDITSGSAQSGETFNLTTDIDSITGTSFNDSINAVLDGTAADSALNGLDIIDGGAGTDTLTILDQDGGTALPTTVQISNVENIVVRADGAATIDLTSAAGVTGVTSLSSTQSAASTLTAGNTTAISVSGATGAVDTNGGSTQTITTAGGAVDSDDAAGAVSVTHTATAGQAIAVDDGTDVTVNASGITTGGSITIGAADEASGAVAVNATGAAYAATDVDHAMGTVAVTGGTTITVDQTASSDTSAAATDTAAVATVTQGAVTVTADANTTAVTVTQDDQVTAVDAVTEVTGVSETQVITFVAMAAGETTVIDGLTFTAAKALTAAEAAAAFANLSASATHGSASSNGIYTGTTSANWTSGAVSGDTVTFTEVTPGAGPALVVSDTAAAGNVAKAAGATGVAAAAAVTGVMGVAGGAVRVDGNGGTASVTSVTLDGYGSADLGDTGADLDALQTLSLANSAGNTTVATAAESLTLTVNDVDNAVNLDVTGATITSLDVTAATEASAFALTAAAVTAMSVDAAVSLDLSGSTLTALETVSVTGAGNVTLGDISGAATEVNASAATGNISVTVDGTSADVTTGSGNDSVTVDVDAISKDIDLGAGDDTLTLNADSTTVPTGTVAGGEGTDTLSMTVASAAAFDANSNLATAISGFERLTISDEVDTDGGVTIDLEALGFSYVTTSGTDDSAVGGDVLTLDNMANNGTVVLTAAQGATNASSIAVAVKDAATTDATLNVVTTVSTADINAGTLAAADVETINITATDSNVDEDADGVEYEAGDRDLSTLDLDATSATSVVVDGNANLTLDMTGNTAVTSLDASALTGNLTVTAFGTATVTGGTGDDALTADGSGDTLLGGAGADTLTGADLTTLTGGEGNDTFVVNVPTNVNSYSTITDLSSGDVLQLTATESFVSTAITLADTAVFQDYANAAVNQLADDNEDAAWFQFGGNTYVVINDDQGDAIDADFENGADAIIQITGTVDLSTASYNQTDGTLVIA